MHNTSIAPSLQQDQDQDQEAKVEVEQEQEDPAGISGLARSIWMGSERSGWQARRLAREREALESGQGYGDIIMGQVREVFPGFGGGRREEEEGEGEGEKGGGGD